MEKTIVSLMVTAALFAAFICFQTNVYSQTEPPLDLIKISNALEFVRKKEISIEKVIEDVKKSRVDFTLTAENEKRLRNEGATDRLIEAIRQHSPPIKPTVIKTRTNSIGMEFVYIPPGEFMMGSSEEEIEQAFSDCKKQNTKCERITFEYESPKHKVTIKNGFWLGKYEVTQEQWQSVMGKNPSSVKECETKSKTRSNKFLNCPVSHVSWELVQEFLTKLNDRNDGFEYRLPSEAEWEYAARAGTTTAFSFGDSINTTQANFDARRLPGKFVGKASAVGSYSPNAFGLYDMHGNVWEWCQDIYTSYKNDTPTDGSANTKGSSGLHVARGGAWDQYNVNVRSAKRHPVPNVEREWLTIGFRVATRENIVKPSK